MKTNLNAWLIRYLSLVSQTKGFTLIELLIVIIIIGVLSAIAIPNFMNQIGRARETEAKSALGIISRGQQAYHYEHRRFYNGSGLDSFVGFSSTGKYYEFTSNSSTDTDKAFHTAYARDPVQTHARDFAAGVYYAASSYSQTICMADAVDADGLSSSVQAQNDGSCSGGAVIK